MFDSADLISVYTRAQALEDGQLVDATSTATEAGFKIPTALTRAVFLDCVAWTRNRSSDPYQNESGRLWDVVFMAGHAMRSAIRQGKTGSTLVFRVARIPNVGRGHRPVEVTLKVMVGPGDQGEPVATIMLPTED